MKRALISTSLALLALVFASSANAATERSFVGLWQGIDAADGGAAVHSITCSSDGTCQLVGTDSVVSLCEGGSAFLGGTGGLEGDELVFPDVVLTCPDTVVDLELRYERDRQNRTLVATAVVGGTTFRSIVLHKISR